jgi:hypothetical protein
VAIPAAIEKVALKLLAKDPHDRFQTAPEKVKKARTSIFLSLRQAEEEIVTRKMRKTRL